ncbi:MAG: MarC family protein [Taibaiella sp.]|nr:MarC family protein [Taibaiella sp.]
MEVFGLSKIDISQIVTVSFTLFAVIDVLGSLPVIIGIKKKMGDINALQATLVSGGLMLLFFFIGEKMLRFMGLDIKSFAIAGSIVIFILGLEMVLGLEFFKPDKDAKSGTLVPIAFPLIAGSGTLTTVMSLKAAYQHYNILIAIFINLIIIYITLRSINLLERLLGPSGIFVIRKFFGVILIAIAVKIFMSNTGLLAVKS